MVRSLCMHISSTGKRLCLNLSHSFSLPIAVPCSCLHWRVHKHTMVMHQVVITRCYLSRWSNKVPLKVLESSIYRYASGLYQPLYVIPWAVRTSFDMYLYSRVLECIPLHSLRFVQCDAFLKVSKHRHAAVKTASWLRWRCPCQWGLRCRRYMCADLCRHILISGRRFLCRFACKWWKYLIAAPRVRIWSRSDRKRISAHALINSRAHERPKGRVS